MNDLAYVKLMVDGVGWSNHFDTADIDGADVFEVRLGDLGRSDWDLIGKYRSRVFSQQNSGILRKCEDLGGRNFVMVHGGITFEVDDYVPDFNDEMRYLSRLVINGKVRGVFCNTEWQKINLSINFGIDMDRMHVAGFPISSAVIKKYTTPLVDEDLIMCPGRFDPEKMLPMYAHALLPLVSEGYRVVFTTNVREEDMARFDPQMMLFVSCMRRRGMEVHFSLPSKTYYDLLSRAGSVVVRGFAESFNIVAVESAYLGRRVVCPDIPPYGELFKSGLFSAFDEKEIISMVKGRKSAVLRSEDAYMDRNVFARQFEIARECK